MMNNKILVVYCSRFGSTAEISKTISEYLLNSGFEVTMVNLKHLKRSEWPKIKEYRGLIIGTGIKFGKWTREVDKFVKSNVENLKNFYYPKGFFVTSGYASDPDRYKESLNLYIEKKLQKYQLSFTIYDAFGGVFDLTKTSKLTWIDKKIVMSLAKQDNRIDVMGKNDFRDWTKIENFAKSFVNNKSFTTFN